MSTNKTIPNSPSIKSKAIEALGDPFLYEFNGQTFELPPLSQVKMPFKQRRAFAKTNSLEQIVMVIEQAASPEALAVIDEMMDDEVNEMVQMWGKHSGTTAGN